MARKTKHIGRKPEWLKRQDEIRRQEHFESGGSVVEWNGKHSVHNSQKRRSRKNDKIQAIQDSEE